MNDHSDIIILGCKCYYYSSATIIPVQLLLKCYYYSSVMLYGSVVAYRFPVSVFSSFVNEAGNQIRQYGCLMAVPQVSAVALIHVQLP